MMKLFLIVFLGITLIVPSEAELNDGWAMECNDSQRTGFAHSDAPDTAYLLWKSKIPLANLYFSPLGSAQGFVQRTSRSLVVCFNKRGEKVWSIKEGADSLTIIGDRVIISNGQTLSCLNLRDGSLTWETETIFAPETPLLTEESVCFASIPSIEITHSLWTKILSILDEIAGGCDRCEIACHDIDTGEITWLFHEEDDMQSIAYDQDHFIVRLKDGRIYSLSKNTRKKLWEFESKEKPYGYSALHDQQVIFSGDSHLFCVDKETGHLLWKTSLQKGSSPGLAYGRIFISSDNGLLFCIDEYTGELLWKVSPWIHSSIEPPADLSLTPPVIADGKVFVGSWDKNLYAFSVDDGSLIWKHTLDSPILASPSVIEGIVLVPSMNGILYAFGIDPETYFEKAQTYLERKDHEKALKYFEKAKEWYIQKDDSQRITLCKESIETTKERIEEYSLISESVEKAQEYYVKGNEALLRKQNKDALQFFRLSMHLYNEIGYRNEAQECEERIALIEKNREQDPHIFSDYLTIAILFACIMTIGLLFHMRKR